MRALHSCAELSKDTLRDTMYLVRSEILARSARAMPEQGRPAVLCRILVGICRAHGVQHMVCL